MTVAGDQVSNGVVVSHLSSVCISNVFPYLKCTSVITMSRNYPLIVHSTEREVEHESPEEFDFYGALVHIMASV